MRIIQTIIILLCIQSIAKSQWKQINNGLTDITVEIIKADGPNILLGTFNAGAYMSSDTGNNWSAINTGLTCDKIWSFQRLGSKLFVGGANCDIYGSLYLSTNNGTNWIEHSSIKSGIFYFAVDGGNTFLASDDGIYRSSDAGNTWSLVNTGFTGHIARAIVINGSHIFATTCDEGVFLSTNNGNNWTPVNTGITTQITYGLDRIGSTLFVGTFDAGIFKSTNNGSSWVSSSTGLTNDSIRTFAVIGSNIFAGTLGGGVFLSTDLGDNWTAVNTGLGGTFVATLEIIGSNIFAGTLDSGAYVRPLSDFGIAVGTSLIEEIPLISVSPNPMTNLLTISFKEYQSNTTVQIFDMYGKVIENIKVSGSDAKVERGTMKAGVYFISITDESTGKRNSQKIVVID